MQVLSPNDLKLFKNLLKASPEKLMRMLNRILCGRYSNLTYTGDYLYAIGNIPIGLVAHVDTVFPEPPEDIYYDREKGVMWSPQGLGADDRAGVFAILKIIQSGLRPTIIFTTDEEVGGLGATQLVKDFPECPIPGLKYLIQLDRRGTNDCVFYDCYNEDFITYVESFGFIEAFGTFSDIAELCPAWDVVGVNLSIGYENEHTKYETLHLKPWMATIEKVKRMLKEKDIPDFEYIEYSYSYNGTKWDYDGKYKDWYDYTPHYRCKSCGKSFCEYEVIPTRNKNKKIVYYCPDCCVDNVTWCLDCGTAYEKKKMSACPKCGSERPED